MLGLTGSHWEFSAVTGAQLGVTGNSVWLLAGFLGLLGATGDYWEATGSHWELCTVTGRTPSAYWGSLEASGGLTGSYWETPAGVTGCLLVGGVPPSPRPPGAQQPMGACSPLPQH